MLKRSLLLFLILSTSSAFANIHLNILGRVENGKLMDQDVELKVKMDTGAKTASLSAHDIQIIEKNDKKWVKFTIDGTHFEEEHEFEYPLKRMVRIKSRAAETGKTGATYERRPVIEMELCLGKEIELVEVNLNDRSSFLYPMLLGRSAMEQFAILIDPSAIYTTVPTCKAKTPAITETATPQE